MALSPKPIPRWAPFVAGLVHDLHRIRLPRCRRAVWPLRVAVLEAQLRDIHEVFGRHGVPFWLRDGTALGVYRDGGILPYDDDADLGVPAAARAAIEAAVPDLEARGFVVYKRNETVIGLLRQLETTELCFSGLGSTEAYAAAHDAFFQRLAPIRYLGREFQVPADIETYLEFCYGSDWRVPKIDAWSHSSFRGPEERGRIAAQFAAGRERSATGPDPDVRP